MSKPSKPPHENEQQAFQEAMRHVKPLKKPHKTIATPKTKRISTLKTTPTKTIVHPFKLTDPNESSIKPEEALWYACNSIQIRQLKRFKQGQLPIDDWFDLHGLRVEAARAELLDFIQAAQKENYRTLLIIHGKGYRNPAGSGILKNHVAYWLRQFPSVLAFSSAQPKHGGTGAVYVLLRAQSKSY